ncbi:MAG: D-alanine--D-alanine ligase [Bacteroidales bacterium]|nr:D-alanine--D-alanine ligase [Bacteroidales bacterium]
MKKNIAILAGGDSSEFSVSMNSAKTIKESLNKEKYNVFMVIVRGTAWRLEMDGDGDKEVLIDKDDFSCTIDGEKLQFDCGFIIIHGTPGENGVLQGYFETLRIPYTTCGVLSSSMTFNKVFSKNYIRYFGIPTSRFYGIKKNEPYSIDHVVNYTGLPCFVKPNRGGSSFGVSKVNRAEDLEAAINKAFEEDYELLVEEFLEGTELTCGLTKTGEQELVFPPTEIVSKKEFFDYEAKYTDGMADEITPARISAELTKEVRQLSSRIYDMFNCRGIVRIDYIFTKDKLHFMEVNTIPGMSAASIVPQQIRANGQNLEELLDLVIEDAIENNQKEGLRQGNA